MGTENLAVGDVQAHTLSADHPRNRGFRADSGSKTARAHASRDARVPHLTLVGQEDRVKKITAPRTELGMSLDALLAASEASEWAVEAMTPVAAAKQIAPSRGEAGGNWIVWSAMTAAGLARFVIVSLGYLIVKGGETRIRAGVVTAVLAAALVLAALAGHSV